MPPTNLRDIHVDGILALAASDPSASSPYLDSPLDHARTPKTPASSTPGWGSLAGKLPAQSRSAAAAAKTDTSGVADPRFRHADQIFQRLIIVLQENPSCPTDSGRAEDGVVTHDNNISFMVRYVRSTRAYMKAHVPPSIPETSEVDKAWAEVEKRCAFIDRGINDNVGELEAITGQFPGEAVFEPEEKELARFLIEGLEEYRVEY